MSKVLVLVCCRDFVWFQGMLKATWIVTKSRKQQSQMQDRKYIFKSAIQFAQQFERQRRHLPNKDY